MQKPVLEICCFDLESALIADDCDVDRIEFCSDLNSDGLTPDMEDLNKLMACCSTKVNVMIRPKAGDSVYNEREFDSMLRDLDEMKTMGVNGIVSGIMNPRGSIDQERMQLLINEAHPLEFTFHRAFDKCNDHFSQLEVLIKLGVDRVLTSGGQGTAMDNLDTLRSLIQVARNRIIVMPGGSVRPDNIIGLLSYTKAIELHSSALKSYRNHSGKTIKRIDPGSIRIMKELLVNFHDK